MRVLLVEDDAHLARSIELMLKPEGFNIYSVDLGEECIDLGKLYDYDIIVLDINLPDISGLEATQRLKASSQLSWIPVVAVTANAMHGDREMVLQAGCDGYLAKPVMKSELLQTVATTLRRTVTAH